VNKTLVVPNIELPPFKVNVTSVTMASHHSITSGMTRPYIIWVLPLATGNIFDVASFNSLMVKWDTFYQFHIHMLVPSQFSIFSSNCHMELFNAFLPQT
jgi:hypothetical protein